MAVETLNPAIEAEKQRFIAQRGEIGDVDEFTNNVSGITRGINSEPVQNIEPQDQTISPNEVSQALSEMHSARDEYIKAKATSRSFFAHIGGNILSDIKNVGFAIKKIFNKATGKPQPEKPLAPTENLDLTRQKYLEARNKYLSLKSVEMTLEIEDQGTYRETLAEHAATAILEENQTLTQLEIEYNQKNKPLYGPLSAIYRNKWTRFGVGMTLNIGIGASAAAGLLPVTAGLIGARIAFGTIGIEGAIHGAQDLYSSKRGARSKNSAQAIVEERAEKIDEQEKKFTKLANNLGSIQEDKIRKNKKASPVEAETILTDEYHRLMAEVLAQQLDSPQTYTERLREMLGKFDKTNEMRDQALAFERGAQLKRLIGAAIISAAVTSITTFDKLPKLSLPGFPDSGVAVTPTVPTTPAQPILGLEVSSFNYHGPDLYYQQEVGIDNVSSLSGTAHNMLAEKMGIHLDYVDPTTNSHAASHTKYWELFYENQAENEAYIRDLTRTLREETLRRADGNFFAYPNNDDVVWHYDQDGNSINYFHPKNLSSYFDSLKQKFAALYGVRLMG